MAGSEHSAGLKGSAARVAAELRRYGMDGTVQELPDSTRSAAEAAEALGCAVAQIAKSLVFRLPEHEVPVLVIASGVDRVDECRLAEVLGEPIERPDARFVRASTGFAIGGVPPVGHQQSMETYLETNLTRYDKIWAAAGTPHAVFQTTPDELREAARATVISVAAGG